METTTVATVNTILGKTPSEWGDVFLILAIAIAIGAAIFFISKYFWDKTKRYDEDGDDEEDGDDDEDGDDGKDDGKDDIIKVGPFKILPKDEDCSEISLNGKIIAVHQPKAKKLCKVAGPYSLVAVKEVNTSEGCVYLNPDGELMIDLGKRKLS